MYHFSAKIISLFECLEFCDFIKKKGDKKEWEKIGGITLIALVVTIIVLLILASISIISIVGDNGIIGKAMLASNTIEEATENETTTMNELADRIKSYTRRDESVVRVPTELKYTKDNTPVYKTGGTDETVIPLSTTEPTTIKDNKDNMVEVPENFGIANDSGDNVAEGIVIEDTDHNQYVWIPVGTIIDSSNQSKTIDLIRKDFGQGYDYTFSEPERPLINWFKEYASNPEGSDYTNIKMKNRTAFLNSVSLNHGYYIARYEAGINEELDQYSFAECSGTNASMTYGDENKVVAKNGSVKPLSKAGRGVWNAVTQLEAATICRAMYSKTTDGVESDLVNSFAWDTAIDFIQKCGNENYLNIQGKSKTDINNPQTTGTNVLLSTDTLDEQCKIFDLTGNCIEWNTETNETTAGPCVARGGMYGTTNKAYTRYRQSDVYRWKGYTFRAILYL